MAKRSAANDLNHDNWDKEEEPEEIGVFTKANADILQNRVIKTAKRRGAKGSLGEGGAKASPFLGFSGFGSSNSSTTASSTFSFLAQNSKNSSEDKNTKQENNVDKGTDTQMKSFPPVIPFLNTFKDATSNSTTNDVSKSTSTSDSFKPFENVFKMTGGVKETDKKAQNLETLKDLNLSCSSWIAEHLEKNPYCILTPIFTDYENYLKDLDIVKDKKEKPFLFKSTSGPDNSSSDSPKAFTINKPAVSLEPSQKEKKEEKSTESKPLSLPQASMFNFKSNGSAPTPSPFGGILSSTPAFNLSAVSAKPPGADSEAKKDDEESDEPPKNDFVPVVEEDSIFDIRCKVFVKKDNGYVSKGVGTMFIKPVKDSKKNQLLVRADTSLGNILVNILLTPGMPIKKMGTNNVMIVCLPTPDSEPPPIPILIRVKTTEDCDNVIKKLEECRGS